MNLKTKNTPYIIAYMLLCYYFFAFINGIEMSFINNIEITKRGIDFKEPILTIGFYFLSLLLTNIIPSKIKHKIIFLRWHSPLPGRQVFSKLIFEDQRISIEDLIKKYGELPTDPEEQNALWYQIYKRKQNDKVVLQSHKIWLLFRDIYTVTSIVIFPSSIFTFIYSGFSKGIIITLTLLLLFLFLNISAQNTCRRFVCNVIAR